MSIIVAFILLLGMTLAGWNIAVICGVTSRREKLAIGFLLGSWLVTLEMMIAYQLMGQFSLVVTSAVLVVTLILEVLSIWRLGQVKVLLNDFLTVGRVLQQLSRIKLKWVTGFLPRSPLEVGLFLLPLGFLVYTWLSNWVWPVSDWDAIALYDFRAQLIRLTGTWADGKALGYFYHYPPFTSLWHGLLYQAGFERVKVLYTLLFGSFLLLTYQFLRERVSFFKALVGIFLLTFAPLVWGHVMVAYTNLPYTVFYCLAVMYGINWVEKKRSGDLWLSVLFLAGSTWVRQSEPFWILVIMLLIWGTWRAKKTKLWLMSGAALALYAVFFKYWPTYTASLNLPPPPASVNDAVGYMVPLTLGTLVHHTFLVTDHVLKSVVKPIIWLLLPSGIVIFWDEQFWRNKTNRLLFVLLSVMAAMIWGGTFYFSFTYKSWHLIGESLTRLTMVCVPLLILLLAQSSLWEWLETALYPQKRPIKKSTRGRHG